MQFSEFISEAEFENYSG